MERLTENQLLKDNWIKNFAITSPIARNEKFFYISGIDDRMHVIKAKDMVETFKVAADDGSLVTTINANDEYVVFGTVKGNIYSMLPDAPRKLWDFHAAGGIVGQLTKDNDSIYFSGQDMNVYRIDIPDIYTKDFIWKCLVPGMVSIQPRVTETMVYQNALGKYNTVSAIDKDTGVIKWTVQNGYELLAESRGRAYVITDDEKLVVMNNVSGTMMYSVNFTGVTKQAYNTIDSKIYIGDNLGRVACLEPMN